MCVGIFVCRQNVKNVHFYGCCKADTTVLRSLPANLLRKSCYYYHQKDLLLSIFLCNINLKKNG